MRNHATRSPSGQRLRALPTLVALMLSLAGHAGAAESPAPREWQIKAAFLYNFTKFIEWPAEKFHNAHSPLIIGVLGQSPFGDELEKAVKDRKINGRDLVVRTVRTAAEVRSVHLLFVSAMEGLSPGELSGALKAGCVLGVGDSPDLFEHGAAIGFVLEADKVRFEVDLDSAEDARVKISAHLLKLAKTVRKRP